jgi:hypothetical protein
VYVPIYVRSGAYVGTVSTLAIHLYEIHLYEIHLYEIHLYEIHLYEIHLYEIHLYEIHHGLCVQQCACQCSETQKWRCLAGRSQDQGADGPNIIHAQIERVGHRKQPSLPVFEVLQRLGLLVHSLLN